MDGMPDFCRGWWCIGGGEAAREIAKQFTLALTVSTPVALPTPEASPVQPVARQPLELAALPPEGLSDKNFLHGEFGENAALWRVRSSRFAHSPWYTVGRGFISHRYLRKLPALDNAHLQ